MNNAPFERAKPTSVKAKYLYSRKNREHVKESIESPSFSNDLPSTLGEMYPQIRVGTSLEKPTVNYSDVDRDVKQSAHMGANPPESKASSFTLARLIHVCLYHEVMFQFLQIKVIKKRRRSPLPCLENLPQCGARTLEIFRMSATPIVCSI